MYVDDTVPIIGMYNGLDIMYDVLDTVDTVLSTKVRLGQRTHYFDLRELATSFNYTYAYLRVFFCFGWYCVGGVFLTYNNKNMSLLHYHSDWVIQR